MVGIVEYVVELMMGTVDLLPMAGYGVIAPSIDSSCIQVSNELCRILGSNAVLVP